jgi:CHAT domain-containing protein/Flp pilus assembly protein TadD
MMSDDDYLKGENLSGKRESVPDEQRLRRYLLGQCSTQESEDVEQAALRNNEVMDLLSVIEDELTEEYVEDELNNEDKLFFEISFLNKRERMHKVLLSATLLKRDDILDRLNRHEPITLYGLADLPTELQNRAYAHLLSGRSYGAAGTRNAFSTPPRAKSRFSNALFAVQSPTTLWLSAVAVVVAALSLTYVQTSKRAPVIAQNPVPAITSVSRRETKQAAFERTYKTFLQGDLKRSQEDADREYQHLRNSDPEWAWKFRILEAESLLWRGMYAEVLTLLNSPPTRPDNKDSLIEMLAIEGVAHARLHQFSEAEETLGLATQMCRVSSEAACGDVIRARGVLAVQHGQIDAAKEFFEQSLEFARAHNDQFLEATALLNLGLTSLQEEHFDEAIDWTDAAYQRSTTLGAADIAGTALGNRGWAYYNLGDSEKSLELSLEAEKRASQVGDIILQLSWITNAGYVYAGLGDTARAKDSYLKALDFASTINGREDIYNSLRALALVSVESGELDQARKYADDAISIARTDHNRLDELYPLLIKGLIAARSQDESHAERIFREVEHDSKVNASLKWRSEHALAQLYEAEGRSDVADREYRAALATFEAARSSLQRNDSKLPFSNNASRIYDDYIHFLVSHGRSAAALQWADFSRARTLAEGLGLLPKGVVTGPPPLDPQQLARRAQGTIFFYWLGEKQSYLWAVTPQRTSLFTLPPGGEIDAAVQRYRKSLGGPNDVLESSDSDGQLLYRTLIAPAQALLKRDAKVFIIPDGSLNNLNFETLLVPDSKPTDPKMPASNTPQPKVHYWIEDVTIADASSLRILASTHAAKTKRERTLLLVGNSVSPNKTYPELSRAAAQMESVARHFPGKLKVFAREKATPAAYLNSGPEQFSYIHFVAHGTANRLSPLDSAIVLSKSSAEDDSFKLYARDIILHPMQADLVTISACYSSGEGRYSGEGLVGLSWAFVRAGAHSVIAALWEATDVSTQQLMDKFYDELDKGAGPDAALRAAKLSLLHNSSFHNAFYWAPFQLYTRLG